MTVRTQKIISTILVILVTAASFGVLVKLLNLNQPKIFLQTAFVIWFYLWIQIFVLYDLHFKQPEERFRHLFVWKDFSQALNYLLLPGFLFWGTTASIFIEFGHLKAQMVVIILSTAAMGVSFYYIKEVFSRKKERVDQDIFVALSVVKIYAVALFFGSFMALMRSYCKDPKIFLLAILCSGFLLVYQALYQHRMINLKNTGVALVIGLILGVAGYFIYIYWGYNFFTAAVFFTAIYNLLWGTFHYHLDHSLNWKIFLEILIFCLIAASMVFSVTNFRARILDDCPAIWRK